MMGEFRNNNPLLMGIVNLSPDSFYYKSRKSSLESLDSGKYKYADMIDVGCESSRPGAKPLDENMELDRLIEFVENNSHLSKKVLSIDTYKPRVAKFALNNGFTMINDIKSGNHDGKMMQLASDFNCPIVLMHMKGIPETMQDNPCYDNIIDNILMFFEKKIKIADSHGINLDKIILDPGIGFGKRIEDNDAIINNLNIFKQFGCKLLIGISRKSFLSVNRDEPSQRLSATVGVSAILMQNGIDIIRTHDIDETYKLKVVVSRIINNKHTNKKIMHN